MNSIGLFLELGGNEIINAARSRTYLENGIRPGQMSLVDCCEPCATLPQVIGDEPYQLPDADPAPWYDESGLFPESADFGGLIVETVELSAPMTGRSFTQNVGNGAAIGRARLAGRTLTVSGWLLGRTCCATAYGLRWLQAALMPVCVGDDSCGGVEMCFLSCCPSLDPPTGALEVCPEPDPLLPPDEAEACAQPQDYECRDDELTEFQRGAQFWRRMQRVGLLEGVEVTERIGAVGSCGCSDVVRVEFTLGIGTPYVFEEPTPCLIDEPAPACVGPVLPPIRPDELPPCEEFPSPRQDPQCPPPPAPPTIPIPVNDCIMIPQSTANVYCQIGAPPGGDWFDATTIVEITADTTALRGVVVRMWDNPRQLECGDPFFTDCNACSTAYIQYIPAGGTLRIDGVERRSTITQGLVSVDASPNLYTLEGRPFSWLDLSCRPACVEVAFPCDAGGATASVWVARRALY